MIQDRYIQQLSRIDEIIKNSRVISRDCSDRLGQYQFSIAALRLPPSPPDCFPLLPLKNREEHQSRAFLQGFTGVRLGYNERSTISSFILGCRSKIVTFLYVSCRSLVLQSNNGSVSNFKIYAQISIIRIIPVKAQKVKQLTPKKTKNF